MAYQQQCIVLNMNLKISNGLLLKIGYQPFPKKKRYAQGKLGDWSGRSPVLPKDIQDELTAYLYALRDAGGVTNSAIVIAAAPYILQKKNPGSLLCNGGHIILKKSWAKYHLGKLKFVKRIVTTKAKVTAASFEEMKKQFLIDIKAVVAFEGIPKQLIINWDQTGIDYLPMSQCTMAAEGSKRVNVAGASDKR